ncbi:hypothetical protein WDU94_004056 [Cyamophila willieti]
MIGGCITRTLPRKKEKKNARPNLRRDPVLIGRDPYVLLQEDVLDEHQQHQTDGRLSDINKLHPATNLVVTTGLELYLVMWCMFGAATAYNLPWWSHGRSQAGVVHVFFMHHEPLAQEGCNEHASPKFTPMLNNHFQKRVPEAAFENLNQTLSKIIDSGIVSDKKYTRINQKNQSYIDEEETATTQLSKLNNTNTKQYSKRIKRQFNEKYDLLAYKRGSVKPNKENDFIAKKSLNKFILRRIKRVSETDVEIKKENRDILKWSTELSNDTMNMNTTQGKLTSGESMKTKTEPILNTRIPLAADITSEFIENDHAETTTILPLINADVETIPRHEKMNLNVSNFGNLSIINRSDVIFETKTNSTSLPATSVSSETVNIAPNSPLNSTPKAMTSTTLSAKYMNLNSCNTLADIVIVGDISTYHSEALDSMNTNVSLESDKTAILIDDKKIDSLKSTAIPDYTKYSDSYPDEELEDYTEDDVEPGTCRRFLDTVTINPNDNMAPRKTQHVLTNSDVLTAFLFPFFLVVLVGVILYTIHNMGSYFILRFPRLPPRRLGQGPQNNDEYDDFTDIPLNNVAVSTSISEQPDDDRILEMTIETGEIEKTDFLNTVGTEAYLLQCKSSLGNLLETHQQDKPEGNIKHESSLRNIP